MKTILTIILALSTIQTGSSQQYTLVPSESTAMWTGYGEVGGFVQEGNIDLKKGEIYLEEGLVVDGTIIFDSRSINHENKELKKHLTAKDFFHAKKYPEITYKIVSTYQDKVFGKLTIRDKTNEETFTFSTTRDQELVIFKGKATVDRTKYDIKYNSSTYFQDLGNYAIKNDIDLEFNLVFKQKSP